MLDSNQDDDRDNLIDANQYAQGKRAETLQTTMNFKKLGETDDAGYFGKSNPDATVHQEDPMKHVINTLEGVDIAVDDKGKERRMICKMYVKEGVTTGNVMMLLRWMKDKF